MNRSYEIMYILRPDLEDADVDKSIETFSGYHHRRWRHGEEQPH